MKHGTLGIMGHEALWNMEHVALCDVGNYGTRTIMDCGTLRNTFLVIRGHWALWIIRHGSYEALWNMEHDALCDVKNYGIRIIMDSETLRNIFLVIKGHCTLGIIGDYEPWGIRRYNPCVIRHYVAL